jgi:hypothetical protein
MVIYDYTGSYTGFLGNIMWQTASTIGIAIKNNVPYIFPRKKEFDYFDGDVNIPTVPSRPHSNIFINYTEKNYHYDEVLFETHIDYNLIGYYQSEQYFKHCESILRSVFVFNKTIKQTIDNKYSWLLKKTKQLCSIHVRRGDYTTLPSHHPVLPLKYYIGAINLMEQKIEGDVTFAIFSDDIEWCRLNFVDENFANNKGRRFVFVEGNEAPCDMYLMSICENNIIANSSFSWWASWLNENKLKTIIAPTKDKWYGVAYKDWNLDDMYCKNWLLI